MAPLVLVAAAMLPVASLATMAIVSWSKKKCDSQKEQEGEREGRGLNSLSLP